MLAAAFYLLFLLCVFLIGFGFHKALKKPGIQSSKFLGGYVMIIGLWIAYLFILSYSGALNMEARPPRLPILVILPAFAIIGWFFTAKKFRPVIEAFPIELTVYYQTFRIGVELLILALFLKGLGPVHVTFEGYNFDILAGITAPIIGWLTFSRKAISMKGLLIWNICCLLLLANIVMIFNTLILKPELWGFSEMPVSEQLFNMPYLLIAAFYMPTAVFMHVFSIRKISHKVA